MKNFIEKFEEVVERLIEGFNSSELIIIVNNGTVRVIEKGQEHKNVTNIEFSAGVNEIGEIKITKKVI